jgi:hypothetical protein
MGSKNSLWLYALIGYCTNFREFISDFKESLKSMEEEFYMDGFHLVDTPNIWEHVAFNCYGNYKKDTEVLANIKSIYISYDEINNLVAICIYNCFDKYKPYNEEHMAKEVLSKAANLIDEPESWIFKVDNLASQMAANFFVKKLEKPVLKEQFDVNDSMYYNKTDIFGKEIASIKNYTSMYDIISDSGIALSKEFGIGTTDPTKFMDELAKFITESLHDTEALAKLNAIKDPYTFFELEYKPIQEAFTLVRELSLYAAKLIHFNTNKLYNNAEVTSVTSTPAAAFTTQNIIYSKEPIDFILMSCGIEKEVLDKDISNDLRKNISENSNEDFFDD